MNVSVVGVLVALGLVLVIWLVVVAPAERRYHERKLKILEERIARRQARLMKERAGDLKRGSLSMSATDSGKPGDRD